MPQPRFERRADEPHGRQRFAADLAARTLRLREDCHIPRFAPPHTIDWALLYSFLGPSQTLERRQPLPATALCLIPGRAPTGYCPVYGFQTECGRTNWVRLIVEAVTNHSLDGVFIDGFQGCAIDDANPTGGCCPGGSPGSQCSAQQKTAWMMGLREALWALKAALGKLKKTIICNKTGGTYACGTDSTKCFCDASNSERFGGGPGGVVQLTDYHKLNPEGGVIVHVPHINDGQEIFNTALAAFLLGASAGDGFGIGFQYECRRGGWLDTDKCARRHTEDPKCCWAPDIRIHIILTLFCLVC